MSADPAPSDDAWARLAKKIAALPVDGDPATLRPSLPKGVTLTTEPPAFTLTLAKPADAASLARAFHWLRPYAISGDVHQRSWDLEIFVEEIADPYNHRIATARPRVGAWVANPELDGRPEGDLPKVVAGASPAYDLEHYHAKVRRIELRPPDRE